MEYLNFSTVFFHLSLCTQVQVAQQMGSSINQWQITQQRLLVDSKSEFPSCSHMWGEEVIVSDNSMCVYVCSVPQSRPTLCDPVDCSLPGSLSMEFSRQEYWSGLLFPPPGGLTTQGSNPHLLCLLHWQADSLALSHLAKNVLMTSTETNGQ